MTGTVALSEMLLKYSMLGAQLEKSGWKWKNYSKTFQNKLTDQEVLVSQRQRKFLINSFGFGLTDVFVRQQKQSK